MYIVYLTLLFTLFERFECGRRLSSLGPFKSEVSRARGEETLIIFRFRWPSCTFYTRTHTHTYIGNHTRSRR